MITEEQLIGLGFERIDPEWDDTEEFHFFSLFIAEDFYVTTNCNDEDPAFIVESIGDLQVDIRSYDKLKALVYLLKEIV